MNLQEYASYPHPDPSSGWTTSPLVILSNRSVATVAVGFAHLLLLFAQVYLLNCLDIDNLEQRRGKLVTFLFVQPFEYKSLVSGTSDHFAGLFLLAGSFIAQSEDRAELANGLDVHKLPTRNFQNDHCCPGKHKRGSAHILFKVVLHFKVLASALLLLGALEAVHIFVKMRKCIKQIDMERENDEFKPQRPPI